MLSALLVAKTITKQKTCTKKTTKNKNRQRLQRTTRRRWIMREKYEKKTRQQPTEVDSGTPRGKEMGD